MKKQHYTAEIPVSNPYNFAAFEDLIANIQSGYNEEKRLKNAAFEFMINKGIYVDFHEWLHNPAPAAPERKYPGTVPPGCCRDHPDRKIFRAVNAPPASAMTPGPHFRGPFPYSASPATDRVTTEKGIENKPVPDVPERAYRI